MKINLDDIVYSYINLARNITANTGEDVEIFIKDIKLVETYMDYNEETRKPDVFTCFNSVINFNPILQDFSVFKNK